MPSNQDDVIDSRDIIARIEELETDTSSCTDCDGTGKDADGGDCAECDDIRTELAALKLLKDEASGSPDWEHGETLIRDSYFREYAEQLADDIGAISRDARWPLTHIDWDAAADELKQDYTSVNFDNVIYWIRS